MGENVGRTERILEDLTMKERDGITRTRLEREREAVVLLFSKNIQVFSFGVKQAMICRLLSFSRLGCRAG